MTRFYSQVPKTLVENLEFRKKLRQQASGNAKVQRQILEMCRQDTLFFVNCFCYAFEPRNPADRRCVPMITWGEQDDYFLELDEIWGKVDLWCQKRRAAGFSVCTLLKAQKEVLFTPYTSVGLISKDEKAVDDPDSQSSLMWKLDWQLQQLPRWMVPPVKRNTTDHTLYHPTLKSGFTGYAATANAMSGARFTAVVLDELGKWKRGPDRQVLDDLQHVTNCRIVGSSYFGRSGEFYEKTMFDKNIRMFVFDWKANWECSRGLYKVANGEPVPLDAINNPLTDELIQQHLSRVIRKPAGEKVTIAEVHKALKAKGFQVEGSTRSPWYDAECMRSTGPQTIAQELDRDPQGTESNYIDPQLLRELSEGETATARPPRYRGVFLFDAETLEGKFVETADGELLIWCELTRDKDGTLLPPKDTEYVIGCDVSYGAGASNSVIHIGDAKKGEQVGEFAHAHLTEAIFARTAMAIGKWFRGASGNAAYLAWEANGNCGKNFTASVKLFSYSNAYMRKEKETWWEKREAKLGWHSHQGDKTELLGGVDGGGLKQALMERSYTIRSLDCLIECGQYVIDDNQKVVHLKSKNNPIAAGRNEAHGDRVIGAGLAMHLIHDRPVAKEEPIAAKEPPYGGWEWRRQRDREREGAQLDDAFAW